MVCLGQLKSHQPNPLSRPLISGNAHIVQPVNWPDISVKVIAGCITDADASVCYVGHTNLECFRESTMYENARIGILTMLISLAWLTACAAVGPAGPTSTRPPLLSAADVTATATVDQYMATIAAQRSSDVPDLPFADNPDPNLCGIPIAWGLAEPAWLTGRYAGKLVQPDVLLYDSHLRLEVVATVPHGAEVQILLFQTNPTLNYYLVKVTATGNEGWLPEPFLAFEPPAPQ